MWLTDSDHIFERVRRAAQCDNPDMFAYVAVTQLAHAGKSLQGVEGLADGIDSDKVNWAELRDTFRA